MSRHSLRAARRLAASALALAALAALAAPAIAAARTAQPPDVARLGELSLEELTDVVVTSVSKRPEPLAEAPAAVYVIGNEQIRRSGAVSLAELLRQAPNLQVAQNGAAGYAISARGLNGHSPAQNFPNKLLVLIDGRSVYSPLYSGVYWDVQDTVLDDIDRIEVISGPAATLWGANAVNGVINITTRPAEETQGALLNVQLGNVEKGAGLRYGGTLTEDLAYRVYAKGFQRGALRTAAGASALDRWNKPQGGFRVDWHPGPERVTLQGDLYRGTEDQGGTGDQTISGGNAVARWERGLSNGTLQLQGYFDQVKRSTAGSGAGFLLRSYDVELQHSIALGSWNRIVWGVGDRISRYRISPRLAPDTSLIFDPARRTLNLANGFLEDRLDLTALLSLTAGIKVERDPFSGLTPMPSLRAAWQVDERTLLWAAASRAIRSPTPFDHDVVELLGATPFLTGNANFRSEKLWAFEMGYRAQFGQRATLSVNGFDDRYDDLRSIEFSPTGFPLLWGNRMQGHIRGVEIWGDYRVARWWTLRAGFNAQYRSLHFKPGASRILGEAQAGNDPHHQFQIRSSMDLAEDLALDVGLRQIGRLPSPANPAYAELEARLAWRPTAGLELAVAGANLLHAHHPEYAPAPEARRSVMLQTRWML